MARKKERKERMILRTKFIFSLFIIFFIFILSPAVANNKLQEKKKKQIKPLSEPPQTKSETKVQSKILPKSKPKKIAFLFLIRYNLPFLEIWQEFFTFHARQEYYNIYVHSSTPYVFEKGSVFYNRTISEHIETSWGKFSLIQATRALLKAALSDDFDNYYFALFSESCIPLYAFTKFYRVISSDIRSIVFTQKARINEAQYRWHREYDSQAKLVKTEYFRKTSQWFMLNRKHALIISFYIIDDDIWANVPAADEYLIPSALAALHLQNETTNSGGFTFVNWTSSVRIKHPQLFKDVDEDLLFHLRFSHAQYAAQLSRQQRETLTYHIKCAGYYGLCHFAARKISATAKFQLLAKLSFLLIDDRDDLYLPPNIPLNSSSYYEDGNMFHHHSSHNGNSSMYRIVSYPSYDYAKYLLPKVRKCISDTNNNSIDPMNDTFNVSNENYSADFWKELENSYSFHFLDNSTKVRKLFPNFYTLRFLLRLPEKDYSTKELLMKIPTITKLQLLKYVKKREEQFPSLQENLIIRDGDETMWIIQSFERHVISAERIQELFDAGKIKSPHPELMPEILLGNIPIGKPYI